MKMRNLIVIIFSLIIIIILLFVVLNGSFLKRKYNSVWNENYINKLGEDRLKIIGESIRTTSSHNSQPWLVKLTDNNSVELYADMSKSLDIVDNDKKQLLISEGAFIESFRQSANKYGYDTEVKINNPNLSDSMPLISKMVLFKNNKEKNIDSISSSSYFLKEKKDENINLILDNIFEKYPKFSYEIIEENNEVDKLENILLKATIIESQDEEAVKELLNVFRFTEWQKNKYRYGLSLASMPEILKLFIQPILNLTSNNWQGFGESSIKQFEQRLENQNKYILIKCDNPNNLDYINCGQIYQNLLFEISSYSLRPAMQVLENFEAMKPLNLQFAKEYNTTVFTMMIIGLDASNTNKKGSNPRHLVDDIIIK